MRTVRKNSSVLIALLLLSGMIVGMAWQFAGPGRAVVSAQDTSRISDTAIQQIQALMSEKESRTPAQQKIDSQLLYAIKMRRGQGVAAGVQTLAVDVGADDTGVVTVDVTAIVDEQLLHDLNGLGAEVSDVFPQYHSLRVVASLDQLETIADYSQVRFIQPKQEAIFSQAPMQTYPPPAFPDFNSRAEQVRSEIQQAIAASV